MRFNARYPAFALLALSFLPGPAQAQVAWVKKYDDALRQAAADGKFVVLDISASWCPPCQRMAREVHTNDEFIEFSRSQVFMLVDAEKDSEGIQLARKFGVNSYPTILIVDSNGREIDRLIGGRTAEGLIQDLKKIFADPSPFEEAFRRAEEHKDDYDIQFKMGTRAFDREEYSRARKCLERAAALAETKGDSDERAAALILLSGACFKEGKYQDSLKALDILDQVDPKLARGGETMRMLRARSLMALKRYDEGALLIRDMLRSSRSRTETDDAKKLMAELPGKYRKGDKEFAGMLEKAKENLRKGKLELAFEQARKTVESAPHAAEVHLLLAAIHIEKSQSGIDPTQKSQSLASALHELRLARRLDPEDILSYAEARALLAHKYLPNRPSLPEARKAYEEGERFFAQEKYRSAAERYLKVIKLEQGFGYAYRHMGDCFFASGDLEEALKWYQQAALKNPRDAAAYRFAAHALTKLGRNDDAGQWLVRSLLADPEYPMVWQDLEQAARAQGRNLERHSEIVPFQFLVLSMDAGAYDEKLFDNVPQETIPAWREYVKNKLLWRQEEFQKRFPSAQFYYASFTEELDCLRKTANSWSSLKERNPGLRDENLDFLRQVCLDGKLEAFILLELYTEEYRGEFEEWKQRSMDTALAYISEYLMNSPQARSRGQYNSSAIEAFNAGAALHKGGDKVKALEYYRRALSQEPHMVPALTNAGIIYLENKDIENARIVLQAWAEAEPQSARPLAMLAQVEDVDGNRELAADLMEKVVALETDEAQKNRYQDILTSIRPPGVRTRAPQAGSAKPPASAPPPSAGAGVEKSAGAAPAPPVVRQSDENDPIAKLERRLASATEASEREWLHLMLGVAHFQERHWKEAKEHLTKVLEKDPDNLSAREMMKSIEKNLQQ